MIPTDKKERYKIIEYMLEGVRLNYDDLSTWEQNFIDSIEEQFKMKGNLSDKQCEKLEQIYDK